MIAALLLAAACTPIPTCGEGAQAPAHAVVVQHVSKNCGYALPCSQPFPQPNAQNDLIVVAVRAGSGSGHLLGVSDSNGNSYAKAVQYEVVGDPSSVAFFYTKAGLPGPNTVTVSDGGPVGATRFAIIEVAGGGPLSDYTTAEGSGDAVLVSRPGAPGDFVVAAIGTQADAEFTPAAGATPLETQGKLYVQHGGTAATMSLGTVWADVAVAFEVTGQAVCATPTPVIQWDRNPEANIHHYRVMFREVGGVMQTMVDFPVEKIDTDGDGEGDTQWVRGVDMGAPIQRYCPSCLPLTPYEFTVIAINDEGFQSDPPTEVLSVCMPEICDHTTTARPACD